MRIFDEVKAAGYPGGLTQLKLFVSEVRQLRPLPLSLGMSLRPAGCALDRIVLELTRGELVETEAEADRVLGER